LWFGAVPAGGKLLPLSKKRLPVAVRNYVYLRCALTDPDG
jgi:hypothetical protein